MATKTRTPRAERAPASKPRPRRPSRCPAEPCPPHIADAARKMLEAMIAGGAQTFVMGAETLRFTPAGTQNGVMTGGVPNSASLIDGLAERIYLSRFPESQK